MLSRRGNKFEPRGGIYWEGRLVRLAKYTPKLLHKCISTKVKLQRIILDKLSKHIITKYSKI